MQTQQVAIPYGDLVIDRHEIYRAMGYGEAIPESNIEKMLDEVLAQTQCICRPRILYGICPGQVLSPLHITIEGVDFHTGKIITDSLAGSERFCLFVATVGREFEEFRCAYKEAGDYVREFIADSVGSVLAEACVAIIEQRLDREQRETHTYPYSPGYCGWRVSEQQLLFGLLPKDPCGIELSESSLMFPIKSVSGVIGLGAQIQRKPYGCAICRNTTCYKRRISK
ncbi:MAG: vitamin B12 dependent-methionine synthase activation domain-containing protein [Alistipes sp.]